MAQHAAQLAPLLLGSVHVYVCGHQLHHVMAKGVHGALVQALTSSGGMSGEQATAHLTAMAQHGRYARILWS